MLYFKGLFYYPPPNQQNKYSRSEGTSIQEYEWNNGRQQSKQGLGEYWSTEETAACVIENVHNKVLVLSFFLGGSSFWLQQLGMTTDQTQYLFWEPAPKEDEQHGCSRIKP